MKQNSFLGNMLWLKAAGYSIFFCLLLFIPILFSGCSQSVTPSENKAELHIDVESDFAGDSVKIIFDNKVLLNQNITTNYTISAAWLSGTIETTEGFHKVKVYIQNEGISGSYIIDAGSITTLRVNYSRSKKEIAFDEYEGIIFRD